jgi:hypothetical protein
MKLNISIVLQPPNVDLCKNSEPGGIEVHVDVLRNNTMSHSHDISSHDMYDYIYPLATNTHFHIHYPAEVPKFVFCFDRIWASICLNHLPNNCPMSVQVLQWALRSFDRLQKYLGVYFGGGNSGRNVRREKKMAL